MEMSRSPPLMKLSASLRLRLGHHRAGVGLVPLDEGLLEVAQPEEVVLLLEVLHRHAVDRAQRAVDEVVLGVVLLAGHAVQAAVDVLVDVAVLVDPAQEVLDRLVVPRLGGADEVVVGDVEIGPGGGEPGGQPVGPPGRGETLLLGGPGHLLPVLVGAGEEEDVVADQSVPAGQGIGVDRRVGVPHVGGVLDVVDRCGDVVAGHCQLAYRDHGKRPSDSTRGRCSMEPSTPQRPALRQRVAVYGICEDGRRRVLLVRAARYLTVAGRWFLPGGGIDHGEDPVTALRREFAEETGLQVEVGDAQGRSVRRQHAAQRDPPAHHQDRLRHRLLLRSAPGRDRRIIGCRPMASARPDRRNCRWLPTSAGRSPSCAERLAVAPAFCRCSGQRLPIPRPDGPWMPLGPPLIPARMTPWCHWFIPRNCQIYRL